MNKTEPTKPPVIESFSDRELRYRQEFQELVEDLKQQNSKACAMVEHLVESAKLALDAREFKSLQKISAAIVESSEEITNTRKSILQLKHDGLRHDEWAGKLSRSV